MAEAERWAAGIKGPAYAIDAQTAIKVTDGSIEVVSEGHWKLLNPAGQRVRPCLVRARPSVRFARRARRPASRSTQAPWPGGRS